jgi:hypothetical protein
MSLATEFTLSFFPHVAWVIILIIRGVIFYIYLKSFIDEFIFFSFFLRRLDFKKSSNSLPDFFFNYEEIIFQI